MELWTNKTAAEFSASNQFTNNHPRYSDCSWKWLLRGVNKRWAEFYPWNVYACYSSTKAIIRQIDGTAGCSASNMFKPDPPWSPDCSLVMLYKGVKKCTRNFSPSKIGDVFSLVKLNTHLFLSYTLLAFHRCQERAFGLWVDGCWSCWVQVVHWDGTLYTRSLFSSA